MVDFANGSAVELYYIELVAGAIPSPAPVFKPIRFVSESMSRDTTEIESKEIVPGRQKTRNRQGTYSTTNTLAVSLSSGSFDDLIEAALQGTWAANVLEVGTTRRKFAILERHTDVGLDYIAMGCEISSLNIAAPLNDDVGLTFDMVGTSLLPYTLPGDEVFDAPNSELIMVTSQGFLKDAGVTIGYATDFTLSLTNSMTPTFVLFQREAYSVSNGIFAVSGSLSAGFINNVLYNKFLNETGTDFEVQFTDGTKSYTVLLPDVGISQGDKAVGGPDAIIPSYNFTAGYDATEGTTARVTRVP